MRRSSLGASYSFYYGIGHLAGRESRQRCEKVAGLATGNSAPGRKQQLACGGNLTVWRDARALLPTSRALDLLFGPAVGGRGRIRTRRAGRAALSATGRRAGADR